MDRNRFLREELGRAEMIGYMSERLEIKARLTIACQNNEPYDDVMNEVRLIRKRHYDSRLAQSIEDLEKEIAKSKKEKKEVQSYPEPYIRSLISAQKSDEEPTYNEKLIAIKEFSLKELQGMLAHAISELQSKDETLKSYENQNRDLEHRLRILEGERLKLVDMIGKINEDNCTHITPIKYHLNIV